MPTLYPLPPLALFVAPMPSWLMRWLGLNANEAYVEVLQLNAKEAGTDPPPPPASQPRPWCLGVGIINRNQIDQNQNIWLAPLPSPPVLSHSASTSHHT